MIEENTNNFNIIYDTQLVFRKLLDSMARPGKINSVEKIIKKINTNYEFSTSLIAIAFTLLDESVKFTVISKEKDEIERYIKWNTGSTISDINVAEFIFIDDNLEDGDIEKLMYQTKPGTFLEPEMSTTIILSVKRIQFDIENNTEGVYINLKGPGIDGINYCFIKGISKKWIEIRNDLNREFPIGIDMILCDRLGNIIGLPRTTKIELTRGEI